MMNSVLKFRYCSILQVTVSSFLLLKTVPGEILNEYSLKICFGKTNKQKLNQYKKKYDFITTIATNFLICMLVPYCGTKMHMSNELDDLIYRLIHVYVWWSKSFTCFGTFQFFLLFKNSECNESLTIPLYISRSKASTYVSYPKSKDICHFN